VDPDEDDVMADNTAHRAAALLLGLALANLLAWGLAWLAFADRPVLLGVALLAWILGLRHAVDADHIAAIDSVVRKLMGSGQRPLTVGLYFSLGHSTVVASACAAIATTAVTLQIWLLPIRDVAGIVGTSLSALFLLTIAMANLLILRSIWRDFGLARRGIATGQATAGPSGLLATVLRPVLRTVTRGWHMYPVGLLFAIGFDTATEVGLLGLSATQATQGLTLFQSMVFPALFTAGMALVDTADSVLMVGAYGWASINPMRKLWYNLTITSAAAILAMLIGGIEVMGLVVDRMGLQGRGWRLIAALNDDLTNLGGIMIAAFALCWAVSALVYRWKRYDRLVEGGS
jgi:nickel/cobalt transporter (NiCoT) family protein